MTKVMCFGTFDLLHLGHLNYFKQAKELGTHLTVVIARDQTKINQKKETIFTEDERLELIQSLKIANEAVLGNKDNHIKIIQEKNPDVLCLGYDHPITEDALKKKLNKLNLYPQIKRAKPYQTDNHKSSKLKEIILKL